MSEPAPERPHTDEVHNDPLEEAFLRFALPIAAEVGNLPAEEVPHEPIPVYALVDGQIQVRMQLVVNVAALLQTLCPEPHHLVGAAQCVNAHLDAGLYLQPPIVGGEQSMGQIPRAMLMPALSVRLRDVLADALVNAEGLNASEEDLRAAYRLHRREWEARSYQATYYLPLLKFTTGVELPLSLSESMTLVPFDNPLRMNFVRVMDSSGGEVGFDLRALQQTKCLLVVSELRERGDLPISRAMVDQVGDFITALRLHSSGEVGVSTVLANYDTQTLNEVMTALDDYRSGRPVPEYQLDQSGLVPVLELFARLRQARASSADPNLVAAIHRFNQSYSRTVAEDRIIDLTIALESSLLAGDDKELQFKLALRGVTLLTTAGITSEPDSRRAHRAFLVGLYEVRSKIVHEGGCLEALAVKHSSGVAKKLLVLAPDMGAVPGVAEEVARSVLWSYVKGVAKRPTVRTVNEALDDHVVSTLGPMPTGP